MEKSEKKRRALPKASEVLQKIFGGEAAKRAKVEEAGPVRLVPHIEGNWATYVFIRLSEVEFLDDLLELQS